MDPADRLAKRITTCTNCSLHQTCKAPVPFDGDASKCHVLIIGEGPGEDEDNSGQPFVGKSGRFLRGVVREAGFRGDVVSYCNVVCCRPPGNRQPTKAEREACRPNLISQLSLLDPWVVVLAGGTALSVFRDDMQVGRDRGRPFTNGDAMTRVFVPTYHPAFVLRKQDYKGALLDDLQQVRWRYRKGLHNGISGLIEKWPNDCRRCSKLATQYDEDGLAYCDGHFKPKPKRVRQMGLEGVV